MRRKKERNGKKDMKKTRLTMISLLLVLTLVFAAACGKDAEGTSSGIVTDSSMNTVTIETPNGSEFTFPIEGAEISDNGSIEDGDEITLFYTGKFDDTKPVQDVKVTKIQIDKKVEAKTEDSHKEEKKEDPKPADPAPAAQPAQSGSNEQTLLGVVDIASDGSTITVSNPGGVDFKFDVKQANLEGTFAVGDNVIVYYEGDLVDKPDVQNVKVNKITKQ